MKRKLTALALALAMVLPLGALPATADDKEADAAGTPDAEGTLSFENLESRMRENYYPLLALGENIKTMEEFDYERQEKTLRDAMNGLADLQSQLPTSSTVDLSGVAPADYGSVIVGGAASAVTGAMFRSQLQTQYNALRSAFDSVLDGKLRKNNDAVERQLRDMQNQTVILGETFYITYKGLQAQDASLTRTIAALERTETEMKLRSELGQISQLDAQQIGAKLAEAKSGLSTLRTKMDGINLQLKAMTGVGLDETLVLAALPSVTAQELAAMDLEADFAKAKEASYELFNAKKTYDDAHDDYIDALRQYGAMSKTNEYMAATHTWQAAQYTYENAGQAYELKFRALFAQVGDCAQILDAKRTALELERKNYEASALKYEQGAISANAFANAKDALAAAEDDVSGAARDLFSAYRSYRWAVDYGILNS